MDYAVRCLNFISHCIIYLFYKKGSEHIVGLYQILG